MFGALLDGLSTWIPSSASSYIAPVLEGAATGALGSALSGGKPLAGALTGGLTGGAIGAFGGEGGALAQALGLSGAQANALIGGLGGGLGYGVTGQNPLVGALLGGAGGYLYAGQNPGSSADPYEQGGAPKGPPTDWYDPNAVNPGEGGASGTSSGGGPLGKASSAVASGKSLLGGGDNKSALLMGVLSALAQAASKPRQGTWPLPGASSNPNVGPGWNAPLNTSAPGRTAVNPYASPPPSYWTYGGPEKTYFTNNSLKSFGFAGGGPTQGALEQPAAAPELSTANGDHYVQGAGDGQADKIPAVLSDGEFIVDASTVSRLGNGSNRRGAEVLDDWRRNVAKAAGSDRVVQKKVNPGALMRSIGGQAA